MDELEESTQTRKTEASVWRLGAEGLLITSVFEGHAASLAEQAPSIIYFFAELQTDAAE